jgi:catechol 2,3-dioxygenase-like lactoylglutathione lyase family enzyme
MSTLGIHHLGLSVANLDATANFFTSCLGWSVVREIPEYPAKFVSNGEALVTLWQTDPDSKPFDRRGQVGLHHVAIKVADEENLADIYQRVSDFPGVVVESPPELLRDGPAKHCMVFEPGGIRVEFICVP